MKEIMRMAKPQSERELTAKEFQKVVGTKGDLLTKAGIAFKGVEIVELQKKAVAIKVKAKDGTLGTLLLDDVAEFSQYGTILKTSLEGKKPETGSESETGQ